MNASPQLPFWRRCLQFRLRTLLILVTLSACAIAGYLRCRQISQAYGFHRLHLAITEVRRRFLQDCIDVVPPERLIRIQEEIKFHLSQMEECRAAYWCPWRSIPAQVTLPPSKESETE